MKTRVGGESSESKEGRRRQRRGEVSPGWGGEGGVGERGGKKADEIRGLGCLFGEIKSKNRCLWRVL